MDISAEPYEITRRSRAPFDLAVTLQLHTGRTFGLTHFLCLSISGGWDDSKPSTRVRPLSHPTAAPAHPRRASVPS